jgi:hypothetical protein
VGSQRHAPAAMPPGKRAGIHCIGGCVGPRNGLDACEKSRPRLPQGFDPRSVQPVASRYTDYAIPAREVAPIVLENLNTLLGEYTVRESGRKCRGLFPDTTGCLVENLPKTIQ